MLRRVVLIDDGGSRVPPPDLAECEGLQVVELAPGQAPPAGTVAVVAGAGGQRVVEAIDALGAMNDEVLALLAEAIDARESFTAGDSMRVKRHATRFADALGLDADGRITLERASFVRDIGKLRVPNDILLKEGLLTVEEWQTIHEHTRFGGDLVAGTKALADTEDIVRHHHECWDGTGYPEGLERKDVPFLARVMRVLDVYCAMTSERSYREGAISHKDAIAHVREEKGKHFDPDLAQAFLDTFGQAPCTD